MHPASLRGYSTEKFSSSGGIERNHTLFRIVLHNSNLKKRTFNLLTLFHQARDASQSRDSIFINQIIYQSYH